VIRLILPRERHHTSQDVIDSAAVDIYAIGEKEMVGLVGLVAKVPARKLMINPLLEPKHGQ
jgi:hypothetical protein